jgi:hypothetical protein
MGAIHQLNLHIGLVNDALREPNKTSFTSTEMDERGFRLIYALLWLAVKDSNLHKQIQSLLSCH